MDFENEEKIVFFKIAYNAFIIIILLFANFKDSTRSLSLKSEWQQVSTGLQGSSEYSGLSFRVVYCLCSTSE